MAKKKTATHGAERCKLLAISCTPYDNLVGELGTYKSVQEAIDQLNGDPDFFQAKTMIIVTESLKVIEVLSRDTVKFYVSNPTEGESNG
jgi:hypothetical protein